MKIIPNPKRMYYLINMVKPYFVLDVQKQLILIKQYHIESDNLRPSIKKAMKNCNELRDIYGYVLQTTI